MEDDPRRPHELLMMRARAQDFLRTHSIAGQSSSRSVRALLRSMRENGWLGDPVVVVKYGGENYLLDGHHRTYAARKANVLVQYRVISIDSLSQFGYDSIEQVIHSHAEAGPNRIRLR